MNIKEFISNDKIVIIAIHKNKCRKFESTFIGSNQNNINYINPCYQNESFINFDISNTIGYNLDIIAEHKNKVYYFKNVEIIKIKEDANKYYQIITDKEGQVFNRRTEFRLSLNYNGTINFPNSQVWHNCIVKDISCHGIGVYVSNSDCIKNENLVLSENDIVKIEFQIGYIDNKSKREIFNSYKLSMQIKRIIQREHDSLVGGIIINAKDIDKLIAEEQRKRAKIN